MFHNSLADEFFRLVISVYGVETLHCGHDMRKPRGAGDVLNAFHVTHASAVIIQDHPEKEDDRHHRDQEVGEDDAYGDQSEQDEESILCKQLQVGRKLNIDFVQILGKSIQNTSCWGGVKETHGAAEHLDEDGVVHR